MKQVVTLSGKTSRAAKNVQTAKLASAFRDAIFAWEWRLLKTELGIAGDKQIQQAIMIVITPGRTRRPSAERDASFLCDVRKGPIMIVVIKPVLAKIGDVDIWPTVIVVVAYRNTEAPAFICHSSTGSDIGESAVVIVVKEHGAGYWSLPPFRLSGRAVQEIDVQPAIVVVVNQGDARAGSFDNGCFLRSSRAVVKNVQASLLCDIRKHDWSAIDEAAGGDWSRLSIPHRRMSDSGRNTHA